MSGRGRIPKSPGMRQRRNRYPGGATLPSEAVSALRKVPELPLREAGTGAWHPEVLSWWGDVWRSPMAEEFLEPDVAGGLYLLAELYQHRWTVTTAKELVALAAEIRLQEVRFGLSPTDRRRLQWTIEQGEEAAQRTTARRRAEQLAQMPKKDPRDVLKLMGTVVPNKPGGKRK